MTMPANFASVKLPTQLVRQAKEAAQLLRRSTAGQIEYWAMLGRVVEHSGLTVQEARNAIERFEAEAAASNARVEPVKRQVLLDSAVAASAVPDGADSLDAIKRRTLAASADGTLQAHIRTLVVNNRQNAEHRQAA